jgi:hypothetical protein
MKEGYKFVIEILLGEEFFSGKEDQQGSLADP